MNLLKWLVGVISEVLALPMLIPYLLTNEKAVIQSDVTRWYAVLHKEEKQSSTLNLLALLSGRRRREFRNLYYFRLLKGPVVLALTAYIVRLFYRELPWLFIRKGCNIGPGLFIQHGFSTVINAD